MQHSTSATREQLVGHRIGDSPYIVEQYVAGGAFGQIYLGVNENDRTRVAIKMERHDAPHRQLYLEFGFYQQLGRCDFIPRIYTFGPCRNGKWHALVMDLLGPSLMAMFGKCEHSFSLRCTAAIGLRLTQIFEYVHERGLIYRDVKPENFLLGLPNTSDAFTLFLIDLGLMKCWRTPSEEHIPFAKGKCITGTPQFMSANMHRAYELSRRDDLEAIIYMLVYLHKGTLPWLGLNAGKDWMATIQKYGEMKATITSAELCADMSTHFIEIYEHVMQLEFEDTPDYSMYIACFNAILKDSKIASREIDRAFDWDSAHEPRPIVKRSSSHGLTSGSRQSSRRRSHRHHQGAPPRPTSPANTKKRKENKKKKKKK